MHLNNREQNSFFLMQNSVFLNKNRLSYSCLIGCLIVVLQLSYSSLIQHANQALILLFQSLFLITDNTSTSASFGAPHIVSPSLVSEFHFRLLQDPAQDSAPDSHKARKGMSKTHTFKSGNNKFCLQTTPTPHAVPTTNDCRWTEKPDLAKSTHQPSDFNVEPDLHLKHIGITYV